MIHKYLAISLIFVFFLFIQFIAGALIIMGYSSMINERLTIASNFSKKQLSIDTICKISNCKKIFNSEENPGNLLGVPGMNPFFINSFISRDLSFIVFNESLNSFIMLKTHNIELFIFVISLIITSIFVFSIMGYIMVAYNREKKNIVKTLAGNEAILTNKSMILITENIHHELNTPMEVIENKTRKIQKILDDYIQESYIFWCSLPEQKDTKVTMELFKQSDKRCFDKKILGVSEDFGFIFQSSEQIYAVLERMKGFKHLRYSNGNKSIAEIIEGAFKVISISNSNFYFEVDPSLRDYSISGDELKNADLLNIIINHIKNSLEANASKIFVNLGEFKDKKVSFKIIDNGNGIPEKLKSRLFKPNFSSKSIGDTGLRGNGLYLNKSILLSCDGEVRLIDSSKYGTIFELTTPAKNNKWGKLYI